MKYYLEITLLPDAEANLGFLWYKVFQQIHIALVDNKIGENQSAVALSIPGYQSGDSNDKAFPLGSKLRLFAESEDILANLDIHKWLNRLSDYCHIKPIKPVPVGITTYARFKRKAIKSIEKKAKRRAEHLNKPYEEVLAFLQNESKAKKLNKLPYVTIESQETKKQGNHVACQFPLFIEQTISEVHIEGAFDCYGLSKTATVPCF